MGRVPSTEATGGAHDAADAPRVAHECHGRLRRLSPWRGGRGRRREVGRASRWLHGAQWDPRGSQWLLVCLLVCVLGFRVPAWPSSGPARGSGLVVLPRAQVPTWASPTSPRGVRGALARASSSAAGAKSAGGVRPGSELPDPTQGIRGLSLLL